MRDCIPSSFGPSADGIWHGLLPVPGLVQPDAPVPPGARASIVVQQGQIQWVGPDAAVPPAWLHLARRQGAGALVTPGLVDCHTHLVYGGQRANEFAMRLAGATYEEVAKAGGGIVSSVKATREASEDELFAHAPGRLAARDDDLLPLFGYVVDALRALKRTPSVVKAQRLRPKG